MTHLSTTYSCGVLKVYGISTSSSTIFQEYSAITSSNGLLSRVEASQHLKISRCFWILLYTSDVCYTENVSLSDKLLKGSSSPYGFDDAYLRKDIQCKTLHIAGFRTSNPEEFSSIKAAAKAHKINSVIFPVTIIGLCLSFIRFAMSSPSAWL
jgi:hypothetical protein